MLSLSITEIALIVGAYLMGSISSAILLARALGLPDPRTQGSGNPGATNVLRIAGKKLAAVVLAGDLLKGLIPVAIGQMLHVSTLGLMLITLMAFLGHLYPVFFHFKGGKGVATGIGVLLAAQWQIGLFICAVWLFVAFVLRVSSLSALTAFILAPLFSYWMNFDRTITVTVLIITILLVWRHRSNIRALLAGREGKIKQ